VAKPKTPIDVSHREEMEENLSSHIFTVSAGLVGVCITVLSLFRVIFRLSKAHEISDGLIALDALGFLVACVFAYLSLRAKNKESRHRFQLIADWAFLMSLAFMVIVGGLIGYEFI
jgi:multisubunit Na+/H+ antiporter MnhF subunit